MNDDAADQILAQWTDERPDLDATPLGVVLRVLSLGRHFTRQATAALAPCSLELWQYDVLSALRRQGAPYRLAATELAAETELSAGAMTNRLKRLESAGLVRRRTNKTDRRGVNVTLTTNGRRLIERAISARLAAAENALDGLSLRERGQLDVLLRKLVIAQDGPGSPASGPA